MPEGHTLHRLAHDLGDAFAGKRVRAVSPQGRFAEGAAALDGSSLVEAHAHGKHLFVGFSRARAVSTLHVHLGLYGSFVITPRLNRTKPADPVGQVRLRLVGAGGVADLRGPTVCELLDPDAYERLRTRLGEDPLDPSATGALAFGLISGSRRALASLLMDQSVIAGVGNVYRAEVLFRHQLDPFMPGSAVPSRVWASVWADLTRLMAEGVTTGRIDTVRHQHLPEAMQREPRIDRHGGEVYVYRRSGDPCLVCGAAIAHRTLEARNVFWCPTCQAGGQAVAGPDASVR